MRNLYSIDDFYVGELYLSYQFGNLASSLITKEQEKEHEIVSNFSHSGAIAFQRASFKKYTDYEKRRSYEGFLTLFLKVPDSNAYLCLHDWNYYDEDYAANFCKNLRPIKGLLPKIDYEIPSNIAIVKARILFEALFKKSKFLLDDNLYKNIKHPIDEYYVGILNLFGGHDVGDQRKNMYQYANLPESYMLYKNGIMTCSFGGLWGNTNESNEYRYESFISLFTPKDDGLLNLCNNQIYTKGIMQKEHIDNFATPGENCYEWMSPFRDYINKTDIEDKISVKKALSLLKKKR